MLRVVLVHVVLWLLVVTVVMTGRRVVWVMVHQVMVRVVTVVQVTVDMVMAGGAGIGLDQLTDLLPVLGHDELQSVGVVIEGDPEVPVLALQDLELLGLALDREDQVGPTGGLSDLTFGLVVIRLIVTR